MGAISLIFCGSKTNNCQKRQGYNKQLNAKKRLAIKEFFVNFCGQFLHETQNK